MRLFVFLDDEILLVPLHDRLDLRHLVTWKDGEMASVRTETLVLGPVQRHDVCARWIGTLANQIECALPLIRELRNPLIHTTEQDLVLGKPFFARGHLSKAIESRLPERLRPHVAQVHERGTSSGARRPARLRPS